MPCELAMVEASELATSATPAVLAKAAGGTLPKLIAAATALVPGAAEAEAGAAGSLGTLDGVPEGLAPRESVAVTEGVLEAAAVPVSEEDGEAPGARRVGVGAVVPVSEPDGEAAALGKEVGGVMVAEAVESVVFEPALGVDAGDTVTDAVAVESAPALVGDAAGETVAEAVELVEFEEPPLGDVAGETEGLAVASSVEVEFDAVVGDAVAVIDALTPAFGVAAGETVALAVAFDDVVGDVVAVAVALAEPAAVDEGDGVALVELSAAFGLAAGDRVAVAVAVALLVEFEPAALAGDNVGVAETVSVAETVGIAVRVAETVGVAEASAPTPLSVMPALT